MNSVLDFILIGLELIFGVPWVAPLVIAPLMLAWTGWLSFQARTRTLPYLNAASKRVEVLQGAIGSESDPVAERAAFSANYGDVAAAMAAPAPGADPLILAWREFQESIVDETEAPVRNTNRPAAFFNRAAPRQSLLIFWSNIMVGLGLILTFLGLIVALHKASQGMATGDQTAMQQSLIDLLTVAGAKFFTSVAGVGTSLVLRFVEHGLQKRTNRVTDALCSLLERGMLYVPPQRLAVEQLDVLREQRDQLKAFNTDFALQLSERMGVEFQQAIAPVTASLGLLNDNMTSMGQGLGQGAAKAIEEASGGELRALGQTLSTLGERLDDLSSSVGSSGEDAARQIRAAGADFAQAATDIREAFDRLTGQVDGMGERFSTQGEEMARAQSDTLERMLSGLESAQTKSADAITEAVNRLQGAGLNAAETMQKEVSNAMTAGVAASQETFRVALEESGEGLRGVAAGLAKAVGEAAEQIDRAGQGFTRSGESAVRTAEAMEGVTGHAKTVAISIGDASKGFAAAAAPVAQAVQAVNEAAGRIARSLEANQQMDAEAVQSLQKLADGIRETQEAAETAWADYRARFENVDKALEQTTVRLGETLEGTFSEFKRFAADTDRELASAVGKLSGALTSIEEYAESLNDYVEAKKLSEAA
ncbi:MULTISPECIES: anti-phage ZorAB system protein ZorA [unclassified Brevundimonas]|uniref:anti-phage ZorAB system protein ZorA n=1 Tax=unclassified Brevundimonas TaxID=2622653 RepID=UPI0006FF7F95|nr:MULTISPECIES: anti-phage ZorAB system protein ZorA [unclassified Brevundimonas]KQY95048.1 hypothetical protein ASD25_17165 [Brevundimonas sp. Root1423]KRA28534.1 hypothetical protein ASD59_01500 [Brevundimonas sp. Root608]